jgi:hypothetical protein
MMMPAPPMMMPTPLVMQFQQGRNQGQSQGQSQPYQAQSQGYYVTRLPELENNRLDPVTTRSDQDPVSPYFASP